MGEAVLCMEWCLRGRSRCDRQPRRLRSKASLRMALPSAAWERESPKKLCDLSVFASQHLFQNCTVTPSERLKAWKEAKSEDASLSAKVVATLPKTLLEN